VISLFYTERCNLSVNIYNLWACLVFEVWKIIHQAAERTFPPSGLLCRVHQIQRTKLSTYGWDI